ncbi:MAG TPA: TonB family protein [Candidatus Acidoferrales bacterium]|nr:TonB family protein [Candidatus Acidoferrales bacterium]
MEPLPAPEVDSLIELSPHARLPRLDLGIDWEPPAEEFRTSLKSVVTGPHAPTDGELARVEGFRVDWIQGRMPLRAFGAASLWHVAVVWLLILPIWGFLPQNTPTLAPVQIELTWYNPPEDLPPIHLPAATHRSPAPRKKSEEAIKPAEEKGADTFHPRQTILSIPVRVTHPRQTLIRPDAPNIPPKIVPQLPNIVQWAAPQIAKPKFQLPVKTSAPQRRERTVQDAAAPEVPIKEKNPGPLNVAESDVTIARPKISLSAMSAPTTREHERSADAAAPEIGAAAASDSTLRNVIALSATPGPPMPMSSVPEGNLAARISISPAGTKPGEPGGENRAAAGPGGSGSAATGEPGAGGAGGASSLPAAISISGGIEPRSTGGGGGIAAGAGRAGKLNLKPTTPYVPSVNTRRGPIDASAFDPSLPPEKILGSEVYTMHVNRPNLTSAAGSWILSFAQLDEDEVPLLRRRDPLAAPVPTHTTDPKYPPELIKGHVQGEVVLYAIIRKDGSVDSIQIVRGLDPQLDRNAIDAFKQWTFLPATRAKAPVDSQVVIHVPFRYEDPHDLGPR